VGTETPIARKAQPVGRSTDALARRGGDHPAMHLTLAHTFAAISTGAAAWLMVRADAAKGALRINRR
jgi:hypothetical protein